MEISDLYAIIVSEFILVVVGIGPIEKEDEKHEKVKPTRRWQ